MSEEKEPSMVELERNAADARMRVEHDVERIAEQLQPEQLKTRALNAAEHSLASLAKHSLSRFITTPRLALSYARRYPIASVAIGGAAAVLLWRLTRRAS